MVPPPIAISEDDLPWLLPSAGAWLMKLGARISQTLAASNSSPIKASALH